jgi:hypothetical protein
MAAFETTGNYLCLLRTMGLLGEQPLSPEAGAR